MSKPETWQDKREGGVVVALVACGGKITGRSVWAEVV